MLIFGKKNQVKVQIRRLYYYHQDSIGTVISGTESASDEMCLYLFTF